jgi:hypothetical protein
VRRDELARSVGAVDGRVKEIRAANVVAAEFLHFQAELLKQLAAAEDRYKQQLDDLRRDLARTRERLAALEARQPARPPVGPMGAEGP